MKAKTIIHLAIGVFIIPFLVSFLALSAHQARAQDSASGKYSREELAQMLAPIALYPDALLSQVLMASTYPIEVIEADRWVLRNPELKDEALDDALLTEDWDPSVKAICHFPSILALMSEKISETTSIGNAFLVQEDEVMNMVQELRAKAYAQGNLTTTSEQKVIVEKETIIIEPADPRVVYVPYYDPFYIYGPWWYPAYPPYYWGPSRVSIGVGLSYWPAFYFGFAFGAWSYFDWHQHYVYIDVHRRPRYVRNDRWITNPGRWNHAPVHRRGVAYRDKYTARKYGQYPSRTRELTPGTRGFPERRDLDRDRIRSSSDRTRIDRETRRDAPAQIDRNLPERQRIDSGRQQLERATRATQERARVESKTQERVTVVPGKPEPQRAARELQVQQRERAPRATQERAKVESKTQERVTVVPGKPEPQRVERDRQVQQRAQQEIQTRERVEIQQQQRSGDSVFNRFEDGSSARQSSERGRVSRQGLDSGASRGRESSGPSNRGGQSDRSRGSR